MTTTPQSLRVVVVDDEPLVNELIQVQLTSLNHTVVGSAHNEADAVKVTCELKPDIVLMDLRMPDPQTFQEDIYAGLKAAQHIQKKCPTPIIILTAHESPELSRRASETGIGAYLVKPVSNIELDRALTISMARFQDLQEVQRLNAELQARNEELDAFAYTVAHNIKHQLAICLGYIELLEMDFPQLTPEQITDYFQELTISGYKLNRIVSELLLLGRVREVKDLNITTLNMTQIAQEAIQRLAGSIEKKQATIHLPQTWPQAIGYAPWIEEIWFNYISNGIKYGGSPPELALGGTRQTDGMVRFWIRDNGTGITEEQQTELFVPFKRLHPKQGEGFGLGLAIVLRIVRRLGGKIGIESENGQGSTFYFTLPAA